MCGCRLVSECESHGPDLVGYFTLVSGCDRCGLVVVLKSWEKVSPTHSVGSDALLLIIFKLLLFHSVL